MPVCILHPINTFRVTCGSTVGRLLDVRIFRRGEQKYVVEGKLTVGMKEKTGKQVLSMSEIKKRRRWHSRRAKS